MNVYFISGLGADGRIFRNIQLSPACKPFYLEWIKPQPSESLSSYAARLAQPIDVSKPFVLIGLSLGGMIGVEIAKIHPPQKLVLISSIPCRQCLPAYYKVGGRLRLHNIIPVSFFQKASFIKRFFSAESGPDKQLVRQMIKQSDAPFIKWGMAAILGWKNEELPKGLLHIHGNQDFILPVAFTKPTHIIKGGGHLMILTHAKEINAILHQALNEVSQ